MLHCCNLQYIYMHTNSQFKVCERVHVEHVELLPQCKGELDQGCKMIPAIVIVLCICHSIINGTVFNSHVSQMLSCMCSQLFLSFPETRNALLAKAGQNLQDFMVFLQYYYYYYYYLPPNISFKRRRHSSP